MKQLQTLSRGARRMHGFIDQNCEQKIYELFSPNKSEIGINIKVKKNYKDLLRCNFARNSLFKRSKINLLLTHITESISAFLNYREEINWKNSTKRLVENTSQTPCRFGSNFHFSFFQDRRHDCGKFF